ncbi:MAG: kelch repeat-containing protein [Deltaproteobacteria bacterium]|jgi:hypothetical protein
MRRAAPLLVLLALGCTGEGSIGLSFRLTGELANRIEDTWLHVTVRDDGGAVLGGAVVPASGGAATLSVRNGEGHVAVVEVREGPDPATARILGYGISEPFSLVAGEAKTVEVEVEIRAVASVEALSIDGAELGFARDPNVTLRITSSRPDIAHVIVAQDPGLSLGRADVDVDGGDTFTVPYDLDAACREAGACVDGPRSVVVQLEDRAGYPSDRASLVVQRDLFPPAVVPGTTVLQLTAPGDFVAVTRADDGIEVRVSFSLTETVSSTPTLALADSELPFNLVARVNSTWVYTRTVGPEDPEGPQQPVLTATDLAGNEAVITLDEAAYDVERRVPDPPDVETPGRIVYRRAAWGTADDPTPRFEVVGQPGAVTPFAFVHVYDDAQVFDGTDVIAVRAGQAQADENGAFSVRLVPVDRLAVYVLAISASGSLHAREAALVQHVQWVSPATASGNSPPPIRALTRRHLTDDLLFDGPGRRDVIDISALTSTGSGVVTAQAPFSYTRHLPSVVAAPDARRFAGTAYDPTRRRAIVVGGRSAGDLVQTDVWEWDGAAWHRGGDPAGFPRCEDGTSFGDDPFGYTTFAASVSQTIVVCRRLDPVAPPPLPETAVDELVAFGWNGQTWADVPLLGEGPVGRVGHAVTYDPKRRRVVVFGGNTGTLQVPGPDVPGFRETLGDTWELEAVRTTSDAPAGLRWTERSPGTTPPPRDRAAMIYDPVTERVLLFGGFDANRDPLDDLWAWDGTTWTELTRTQPWPPARGGHRMVFDPRSMRIGVVAGTDREPRARQLTQQDAGLADTWWWDGAAWTSMPGAGPAGIGITAASVGQEPPVTITGAPLGGGDIEPADTYALSPSGRRVRTPSSQAPATTVPGRGATTFDTANEELLLIGDLDERVWRWSPSGWRLHASGGPELTLGTVAFDPLRDLTYYWGRTFALNPARFSVLTSTGAWTSPPGGPVSRDVLETLVATYDPSRGELVTFVEPASGGWALWRFDGAAWTRFDQGPANLGLNPELTQMVSVGQGALIVDGRTAAHRYDDGFTAVTPAPGGRLAYDPVRERVMAFEDRGDAYELDDAGVWRPVDLADPPIPAGVNNGPTFHHYDPARRRFLATNGSPPGEPPGAVYDLDVDPDARPAVIASVDLTAARVTPAAITGLSATVVAGGAATDAGTTTVNGFEVLAYDAGQTTWRVIGDDTAPTTAPARADVSTATDVGDLVATRPDRVIFAVTTRGRRGRRPVPPTVTVDQLVLAIDYQLTP